MLKKIGVGIILVLLMIILGIYFYFVSVNKNTLVTNAVKLQPIKIESANEKHFNKLMIVAHPDDETIFGGAHLLKDEYLVVCVTCGVNALRLKEFKKAMNYTEDKFIYLGHSDVVNGYISDWKFEEEKIDSEIQEVIDSQDWDEIVTHNPDGEYGHKHHKKISKMVTSKVSDKTKLYYFGIWHLRSEIVDDDPNSLSIEEFNDKMQALSFYKSQRMNSGSRFLYMFKNENWIAYNDWNTSQL